MFEYSSETKVFDGLTERVRAYMRTYHLDLDDIARVVAQQAATYRRLVDRRRRHGLKALIHCCFRLERRRRQRCSTVPP